MSRLFYHTMQDNAGNLLFDVSGTMRLAGTGTVATIYGDEALTIPIANPMTNHASFGSFKCYLGPGSYDFYMAKAGYTFETLTGVQGSGVTGSMAQQNANAVAITGGFIQDLTSFTINGLLGINSPTEATSQLVMYFDKTARRGLRFAPISSDTGYETILFQNIAGSTVGTIATTNTATIYATTSDARLKHDVDDLTGELALMQALRPVTFKWNSDDSPGVGFLANEVAAHVQGVITGDPDAVDDEGRILPQQIDLSKLVPWLVGAVQTLAGHVETLSERVQALETALGA